MAILGEPQFLPISVAASGSTTLVAAQGAGVKIRVLRFLLVSAGTVTSKFQSAGSTDLTGAMTMAASTPLFPGGGNSAFGLFETAANALLNVVLGGAVQVSGHLVWTTAQ